LRGGIEMHHLGAGVHAAVGPPGASHVHGFAGDAGKGGFESVLHRAAAWLGLPAEETAAVVLES
jgi:hypothetical protein